MYEVNWANVQQQDIEMQETFAHVAPVASSDRKLTSDQYK